MRKICLLLCFILLLQSDAVHAEHIAGGSISYIFLGTTQGGTFGNYRITLRLYRECGPRGAKLDTSVAITIYPTGSGREVANQEVKLKNIDTVILTNPDPCISNPPNICYGIGYYTFDITLPFIQNGYVVAFQRCCRIGGIFNVINSDFVGVTYVAYIPGTAKGLSAPINSTPEFKTSDTVIVCADNYFKYDFGAIDPDGDQLEYLFDEAFSGLTYEDPVATIAQPPEYEPVRYNFGFSGKMPLGSGVSIDPSTGMISGVAPVEGIYVLTVAVLEKRNGVVINKHRKDLHLKVADCSIARAVLKPDYINCDGLEIKFQSIATSSLVKTYEWDFGVAGITSDVSSSPSPNYTYNSPGEYTVRLITNKGDQCADTVYAKAKVFPGFKRGFRIDETCKDVPYKFIDTSSTTFGNVDRWKWDFGDPSANNDTSTSPKPSYIYNRSMTYDVSLIVSTSVGCIDTIIKKLDVVDKPLLKVINDTLICTIDTLELKSTGSGSFDWTPNYMINSQSASNPLVSPDVPTTYYVTLTQAPGCVSTDSVFVDVKSFVSLKAGSDTTICLGDSIYLDPITDGLTFQWSPSSTVTDPNQKTHGPNQQKIRDIHFFQQ